MMAREVFASVSTEYLSRGRALYQELLAPTNELMTIQLESLELAAIAAALAVVCGEMVNQPMGPGQSVLSVSVRLCFTLRGLGFGCRAVVKYKEVSVSPAVAEAVGMIARGEV